MHTKIKYIVLFFFSLTSLAHAKWATIEDASLKTSYKQIIDVNKQGLTKETNEVKMEILKEPGRHMVAHYTLKYNSACEQIKILEAKTIYKGKEYKLSKNLIEDKPLASSPHGFDQIRQILLAFPKAEIGAAIYLKYQYNNTKNPLKNVFASLIYFGSQEYLEKANINLTSQLPLHILVNDPTKSLKITTDKEDNFHKLQISLTKPIYQDVIDEARNNIVNKKLLTWVSISSVEQWKTIATKFGNLYNKVFTQALPQPFVDIVNAASNSKNEVDQINTVTSLLNNKIQYMGDWRTIEGGYIPRDLELISRSQLGDCKDFSAATAAILSKLGYKAQIVLVRRGVLDYYPETLPNPTAFNHAMVKVTNNNGKVYWIDPTNFQSMADGVFPDIANKKALITDAKQPGYEQLPNINSFHSQAILKRQIDLLSDNKTIEKGELILKNEEAYSLTGAALQISEENIKDLLFYSLSRSRLEKNDKINMTLPNLTSRIVNDLTFTYSFAQNDKIIKTNMGPAFRLTYDALAGFFDVSKECVGDIFIGIPCAIQRETIINNINIQDTDVLNIEIKSPWTYLKRKCYFYNNTLKIIDVIAIYQAFIPNNDLQNPDFLKLKSYLEKNFKDVAIVFTKQNKKAPNNNTTAINNIQK